MKQRSKGRKAWLITWEWIGEHAVIPADEVVAAILPSQTSPNRVSKIMELLYAAREYSPVDKLNSLSRNPYKARYNLVTVEHTLPNGDLLVQRVPQQAQIYCGHNPQLYGRLVDNLRPKNDDDPEDGLLWDERKLQSTIRY